MTELLEKAFTEVSKLPTEEQDRVAAWLLEELASERPWIVKELKAVQPAPRIAGLHAGAIWMSDDFDEPLPDEFWLGTT